MANALSRRGELLPAAVAQIDYEVNRQWRWDAWLLAFVPGGFLYHNAYHGLYAPVLLGQRPGDVGYTGPVHPGFGFRWIFSVPSKRLHLVYQNRGRAKALDQLYDLTRGRNEESWLGKKWGDYFLKVRNCAAVRNRGMVVTAAVVEHITRKAQETGRDTFTALSVACGSAIPMIRAAKQLSQMGITLNMVMLDRDAAALENTRANAELFEIPSDQLILVEAEIREMDRKLAAIMEYLEHGFDFAEMVGLTDYCDDDRTIRYTGKVREVLPTGTPIIVANVRPNPEKPFVDWTLDWHMKYRWERDSNGEYSGLEICLEQAGFSDVHSVVEAAEVYTISVGYA